MAKKRGSAIGGQGAVKRAKKTPKKAAKKTAKKKARKKAAKKAPPQNQAPTPAAARTADSYGRVRQASAEASRQRSASGRDIGPLPKIQNKRRRDRCAKSLRLFAEKYFKAAFYLGWSPDHLRVIKKMERAILEGGVFAVAMPRGSGKTTLAIVAAIWAICYGHRGFVVLIGCSEARAKQLLAAVLTHLETNDELLADFPAICYPLRRLERIYNRCKGQTLDGQPTRIEVTGTMLVLPTVAGSASSAAIFAVAGLGAAVRGLQYTRDDGRVVRPDLAIPDDPQTDKSAKSAVECEERERILDGAVLGLAGPDQQVSVIMPCTVIRRGDLADRYLSPDIKPEWQGERTRLLITLPTNEKLWDEYAELRRDGLKAGDGGRAAGAFYRKHRRAMDAGAKPAWRERYLKARGELSAIQHAMNLKIKDEHAFWAEYQNEPLETDQRPTGVLTAEQIAERTRGLARGVVPQECTRLTAFADVQQKCLYWMVCAWSDNFTGHVVDYGTWPDQQLRYFTLAQVKVTLQKKCPGAGIEGATYYGLEQLITREDADRFARGLLARDFVREDGAVLQIEKMLCDANGRRADTVKQFCREHSNGERLLPSLGQGFGASRQPMNSTPRKPGERRGLHWRMPRPIRGQPGRYVLFDANFWKSFVHARLATAKGDRGSLTLPGKRPGDNRMLAEQLTAELPNHVRNDTTGRELDEWELIASRDNHWLDGLVGCGVAASMLGCELLASAAAAPASAPQPKMSELRRRKQREHRR